MNSLYTDIILRMLKLLSLEGDPLEVEALMRCAHPTLDGLSASEFRLEVHACALALRSMTSRERRALVISQGLRSRT